MCLSFRKSFASAQMTRMLRVVTTAQNRTYFPSNTARTSRDARSRNSCTGRAT